MECFQNIENGILTNFVSSKQYDFVTRMTQISTKALQYVTFSLISV